MNDSSSVQQDLQKALSLSDLHSDFTAQTVEYFDQKGLLFSQSPVGQIDCSRPDRFTPEYLAVYFDGELVFFIEKTRILLNRIGKLSQEQLFWNS
jgi:hypothetical protein